MFDFEKLHPNHKFAFLDGLLTGFMVAYLANMFYKQYKEGKDLKRWAEELVNEYPSE